MSKRLGRNQKRKLKSEIEYLKNTIIDINKECWMSNDLIKCQSDLIEKLTTELNRAKDIAGKYSAIFNPKDVMLDQSDQDRGFVRLPVSRGFIFDYDVNAEPAAMRIEELPVLIAKINKDIIYRSMHCRVFYGNKSLCGYAITKQAVMGMPDHLAVQMITEQISFQVRKEILEWKNG